MIQEESLLAKDPNLVLKQTREGPSDIAPNYTSKTGLNTFEASLALLSTIIGGGIVGLPYAMYHCGIPIGALLNVLVAVSCYYSCMLYLEARAQIPVAVNSLYELGFVTMGRPSIFYISTVILINSSGLMLIYFMLFGDTFASIIA